MELYPADILLHVINIAALFILLRLILWKPMLRYLDARAARVRDELTNAESIRRGAEELEARQARSAQNLRAREHEMILDSRTKASLEARAIIEDARNRAENVLAEAREKIERERAQAVISARNEIARLATDLAARILKREVTQADNKSAVDDFFGAAR